MDRSVFARFRRWLNSGGTELVSPSVKNADTSAAEAFIEFKMHELRERRLRK